MYVVTGMDWLHVVFVCSIVLSSNCIKLLKHQ